MPLSLSQGPMEQGQGQALGVSIKGGDGTSDGSSWEAEAAPLITLFPRK